MEHIQRGVLLLVGVMLLACSTPPQADSGAPVADNWQVELSVSGGIAGMARYLALDQQGNLRVTDRRSKQHRERQLSAAAIRPVTDAIQALERIPDANKITHISSRCADCMYFELAIRRGASRVYYSADSLSLSDSPQGDLVKRLLNLMN